MDKWNPRVWVRNGMRRFVRWLSRPTNAEAARDKERAEAFGKWLAEQIARQGSSAAANGAALQRLKGG